MANPHLIRFIQSLSSIEARLVEEHLNKSKSLFEEEKEIGKELGLFKFLISNKNETITDSMIVDETGTKRVTDLKNNLFSKVLEVLTFDKYLTNPNIFNESDSILFILKKKLLVFKASSKSLNPGKTEALYELLEEIIEQAKEYEIYDTLVEALTAKKYFRGIRLGTKEFETLNKELEFYEYCLKSLLKAADNYYRLILNNEYIKTLSNSELQRHILNSIKEMELSYRKTKSEQINYYLHILRFALCEKEKNYPKAIVHCDKLIGILKKNKAIFRKERMGFVHDNLALFKIHSGNYKAALKDAKHAQNFYIENSLNYATSKEQEFYSYFYANNYPNANKCLLVLLNHPRVDTGQFRKSKFIYYQACTLFAEGKFPNALKLLNEALEIEKDKTRWNISLRILHILIFIEMNKINEASIALEALRKHIARTEKTDEISERDILIVKLLRELEKDGFEYRSKNTTVEKQLKQLSEKGSSTSWEHYSSELNKFHVWLEGKKK